MSSKKHLVYFVIVLLLKTFGASAGAPGGPQDTSYQSLSSEQDEIPISDAPVRRKQYGVTGVDHHRQLLHHPLDIIGNTWEDIYRYEQPLADNLKLVAVQEFETGNHRRKAIAGIIDVNGQITKQLDGPSTYRILQTRYRQQNKSCWSFLCCR